MKDDDHGTQGTPGPATDNDSVTVDDPAILKKVGKSVQSPGYKTKKEQDEEGRHDMGTDGAAARPMGGSEARDTTGVDPQDPIDPDSPNLIPG